MCRRRGASPDGALRSSPAMRARGGRACWPVPPRCSPGRCLSVKQLRALSRAFLRGVAALPGDGGAYARLAGRRGRCRARRASTPASLALVAPCLRPELPLPIIPSAPGVPELRQIARDPRRPSSPAPPPAMPPAFDLGALPEKAAALVAAALEPHDRRALRLACAAGCRAVDAHAPLSTAVYISLLADHPYGAPPARLRALVGRMQRAEALRFLLDPAPPADMRWQQLDAAQRLAQLLAVWAASGGPPLRWPSLTCIRDCPATCLGLLAPLAPNLQRLSVICDGGGVRAADLAALPSACSVLTALRIASWRDPASMQADSATVQLDALAGLTCLRSLVLDIGHSPTFGGLLHLSSCLLQQITKLVAPRDRIIGSSSGAFRALRHVAWLPTKGHISCTPLDCFMPATLLRQLTAIEFAGKRPSPNIATPLTQPALAHLTALVDLALPDLDVHPSELAAIAAATSARLTRLRAATISVLAAEPVPHFPELLELACGFEAWSEQGSLHDMAPKLRALFLGRCGPNGLAGGLIDNVTLTKLELTQGLEDYVGMPGFQQLLGCMDLQKLQLSPPPEYERDFLTGDELSLVLAIMASMRTGRREMYLRLPDAYRTFQAVGLASSCADLAVLDVAYDSMLLEEWGTVLRTIVLALGWGPSHLRVDFPMQMDKFEMPAEDEAAIHMVEAAGYQGDTHVVLRNAWCVTPAVLHRAEQNARLCGRRLANLRLLWGDDEW